jgi:hypothetical protein
MGITMLRLQLRFAAVALFAAAIVASTAPSAWAFNQETLRPSGGSSSTFTDPDEQVTNSRQGAQPFGPSGPTVQFGVQQGPLTPFGRFQGNSDNASPPDPYYRPPGNGN